MRGRQLGHARGSQRARATRNECRSWTDSAAERSSGRAQKTVQRRGVLVGRTVAHDGRVSASRTGYQADSPKGVLGADNRVLVEVSSRTLSC